MSEKGSGSRSWYAMGIAAHDAVVSVPLVNPPPASSRWFIHGLVLTAFDANWSYETRELQAGEEVEYLLEAYNSA